MFELLLLLLPVAAASGWWIAMRSMKRHPEKPTDCGPAYFKGLNFLLNEQPDKAIDVFVKLLEVDTETVETHLALGNLFRRRGEVDRAIRIHQNLIARPTLSKEQRAFAVLELGNDYMRSGLFDRAESLFNELVEMKQNTEQALTHLKTIYQQEKDWQQCLSVIKHLEKISGKTYPLETAHYYCELAESALTNSDQTLAVELLKKAQSVDAHSVRAIMLQAQIETANGDFTAAVSSYKRIVAQEVDYIPEVLPKLLLCYEKLGHRAELRSYLEASYDQQKSSSMMRVLATLIESEDGAKAAVKFIAEHLNDSPDLEGLEYFIDLNIKQGEGVGQAETLRMLQELIRRILDKQSAYQCSRCGFNATELHWQCPSCKTWGGVKPIQHLVDH